MYYYHISRSPLAILSGPHDTQSEVIKRLTGCGNPELLDLSAYNLVPLLEEEIGDDDDFGSPAITEAGIVLAKVQPTIAEVRRRKRARVEKICVNKLENGITVGGEVYSTTAANRALVLELLAHAERNPTATTVVQRKNGVPVALTLAQIRALAVAMGARTAACLANLKALYDTISTATREQLRAMDLQAGWPA